MRASSVLAFLLIVSAQAQDDMEARAQTLRRELVAAYEGPAGLQEFDHPSVGLRAAGMDYRDIYAQAFMKAFMDTTVGPDRYASSAPPKRPSKLLLATIQALPFGTEILVMRARAAEIQARNESDDKLDRLAKAGMANAKALVTMFNGETIGQAFDSLSPIEKTAAIFATEGKILDGQRLPTPYIVFLCDIKRGRVRGGQAIAFLANVFGDQDQRVTGWENLTTAHKYQALHDAFKRFFADGAAALKGSVEEAGNYLSHFKMPGQALPSEDKLILVTFGKEAHTRYGQLGTDDPERIEMRKAAFALYTGWLYMGLTLVGERENPSPKGDENPVKLSDSPKSTNDSTVAPKADAVDTTQQRNPTDAELMLIRDILKKEKGAYDRLSPASLSKLGKVLRAAQKEYADASIPTPIRKLRVESPVREEWAKTLDFTDKDIFGPKAGQGLDSRLTDVLKAKFREAVVQTVGVGGSVEQAKRIGAARVQYELKGVAQRRF